MKKKSKRLGLEKSTIRNLTELTLVVGGAHTSNRPAQCGTSVALTTCDVSVVVCPSSGCGPSFNTSPEC